MIAAAVAGWSSIAYPPDVPGHTGKPIRKARYWFSLVMKAASNESSGIPRGKQTITEPSAVAPDAKVKLSIKSIAQLMANVDFTIRRYRARFCNGSAWFPKLTQSRDLRPTFCKVRTLVPIPN